VLFLDQHCICYYRKVTRAFKDNNIESMGEKVKPKMSLRLDKISGLDHLPEADVKRFKKLKDKEVKDKYLKISFNKDGIVKGQIDPQRDLDSDDENENGDEKDKAKENEWYFLCKSKFERDEIVSKIYMNTKNSQADIHIKPLHEDSIERGVKEAIMG